MRRLRHQPGHAAAAVLALALGIGCATAIFSVVQAVVLGAVPFPRSEQLVSLSEVQPQAAHASLSGPDFLDLKGQVGSFESLSSYVGMQIRLTGLDRPEQVIGSETDGEFFRVLQASALSGRLYGPGSRGEVVLSERLWKRIFGADPAVLGRTLVVNGDPRTIVGVLASRSAVPARHEMWVSSAGDLPVLPGFRQGVTMRGEHYLNGIARLRPGVTMAKAQAELDAVSARLAAAYPDTNAGHQFRAGSLQDRIMGEAKRALSLLLGGVVLVVLVACANVAGLQLARVAAGERDLAIRAALGASRVQLIRQLLVESLALAMAGGALGLALSWWGVHALVTLAGPSLPRGSEVRVDLAVLLFAVGISTATGIAAGLAPALLASRAESIAALRTGASPGSHRSWLRAALVTGEVALAVMLLAGAILLIRSFERIRAVDPGFRPRGAVAVDLSHAEGGAAEFHAEVARRASAIPGVHAAGSILNLPMSGSNMSGDITPEGRPGHPGEFITESQVVCGDYFEAMGIPLRRGRSVRPQDTEKSARVAVVNEAFARRFFPGEEVLGKRFSYGVTNSGPTDWIQIVGVVGDVRQFDLAQPAEPEVYYPVAQAPTPPVGMTLVVRSDVGFASLGSSLRAEIAAADPDHPVPRVRTVADLVSATLDQRRLSMLLLSIFSAGALVLAVLGIYATLAYSVAQRTREIGVRMALGARSDGVVRLVVGQGMRLALLGAALGVAGALLLGRVIAAMLFGVGAHDPATFVAVVAVLLGAALLACWVPAWRAARVDPVIALRAE
ncbi:MAG: ABC transporter permease [Myxococcales bacterium]